MTEEGRTVHETDVVLLTADDTAELRRRWDDIQARFVDSPRGAVSDADDLVADAIDRVRRRLDGGRAALEERWNAGEEPSTEDLRRTLQQYRLFFTRVLATGDHDDRA